MDEQPIKPPEKGSQADNNKEKAPQGVPLASPEAEKVNPEIDTKRSTPNAQTNTNKRKRKPMSCFEIATTILGSVGIIVAGLTGWAIYKQDRISAGTLEEMKRSGAQSTDQMWQAIGNVNWMARTMDQSQKKTSASLDATLAEMRKQTSAQSKQFALALRQDERTREQLAAHLILENFDVDYSSDFYSGNATVGFDVLNDGNSSATNIVKTMDIGTVKYGEQAFGKIAEIPATNPIGGSLGKGERKHFTLPANGWIAVRNRGTDWFGWMRLTYRTGVEDETASLCILAVGSKHGIGQRSCAPPAPPPTPKKKKPN